MVICLATLTSSAPLTFMLSNQYGQQFMIPVRRYAQLERSDDYFPHNDDYSSGAGDAQASEGGFQPSAQYGPPPKDFQQGGNEGYEQENHEAYEQGSYEGYDQGGHGNFHGGDNEVQQHVEVTNPKLVPVVKEIGKNYHNSKQFFYNL